MYLVTSETAMRPYNTDEKRPWRPTISVIHGRRSMSRWAEMPLCPGRADGCRIWELVRQSMARLAKASAILLSAYVVGPAAHT
jgi:hypothetical protein